LSKPQTRNDLSAAVPKFCHGLETHRRSQEGRVRSAQEFVQHFFPYDDKTSTDRLFSHLPREVRGPIMTSWGVRGQKSALRDNDEKVKSVVHDALVAGDIDATMFEEAVGPDLLVPWIDLTDWWRFWRGGKLPKYSILRALESAYELELFEGEWFLQTIQTPSGKLRGTDVLAEGLTKSDLTEWVRTIYQGGDGSAKGIVAALGWDQIVSKTADDVLLAVLDALAIKIGLVVVEKAPPVVVSPPKKGTEEQLEGEAAANMFKDDELMPISSSNWEALEGEVGADTPPRKPSVRPGSVRPPKRSSKVPPPLKAKG
jgi:hypothetical protein